MSKNLNGNKCVCIVVPTLVLLHPLSDPMSDEKEPTSITAGSLLDELET